MCLLFENGKINPSAIEGVFFSRSELEVYPEAKHKKEAK